MFIVPDAEARSNPCSSALESSRGAAAGAGIVGWDEDPARRALDDARPKRRSFNLKLKLKRDSRELRRLRDSSERLRNSRPNFHCTRNDGISAADNLSFGALMYPRILSLST